MNQYIKTIVAKKIDEVYEYTLYKLNSKKIKFNFLLHVRLK